MSGALVLLGLSSLTATVGALGGLGGAVLLVPLLVLTGTPAAEAAPLGLLSVAAGSTAAGFLQLGERTVNHRLGIVTEVAAALGAAMGALASGLVDETVLILGLAVVAAAAAVSMLLRTAHADDRPVEERVVGEWPGQLAGVAPPDDEPEATTHGVVYRVRRVPVGLGMMWLAGAVAGIAGAGGGFIKTPVTNAIMAVPMRVAAATTTFTIGVTAAAGLVVFALQGRIAPQPAAAVIAGSLVGGQIGAVLQARSPTQVIRRSLGVLLLIIAVVLLATRLS